MVYCARDFFSPIDDPYEIKCLNRDSGVARISDQVVQLTNKNPHKYSIVYQFSVGGN